MIVATRMLCGGGVRDESSYLKQFHIDISVLNCAEKWVLLYSWTFYVSESFLVQLSELVDNKTKIAVKMPKVNLYTRT